MRLPLSSYASGGIARLVLVVGVEPLQTYSQLLHGKRPDGPNRCRVRCGNPEDARRRLEKIRDRSQIAGPPNFGMTYFFGKMATPFSSGIRTQGKMKENAAATPSAALDSY